MSLVCAVLVATCRLKRLEAGIRNAINTSYDEWKVMGTDQIEMAPCTPAEQLQDQAADGGVSAKLQESLEVFGEKAYSASRVTPEMIPADIRRSPGNASVDLWDKDLHDETVISALTIDGPSFSPPAQKTSGQDLPVSCPRSHCGSPNTRVELNDKSALGRGDDTRQP